MANFKRALGGSSEGGGGLIDLSAGTGDLLGQMSTTYWPLLVGGLFLVILMMRGEVRAALPIAGLAVLFQAWKSGMLG